MGAAAKRDTVDENAAFDAIAEPRRREILRLVAGGELAAGEIASAFEHVTRSAISQHITVLKNAGLLAERRDGTRRLYRVRPDGVAALRATLDELWSDALETAKRIVEDERRAGRGAKKRSA